MPAMAEREGLGLEDHVFKATLLHTEKQKKTNNEAKTANQPNRNPSAWIRAIAGYQEGRCLDLHLLKST